MFIGARIHVPKQVVIPLDLNALPANTGDVLNGYVSLHDYDDPIRDDSKFEKEFTPNEDLRIDPDLRSVPLGEIDNNAQFKVSGSVNGIPADANGLVLDLGATSATFTETQPVRQDGITCTAVSKSEVLVEDGRTRIECPLPPDRVEEPFEFEFRVLLPGEAQESVRISIEGPEESDPYNGNNTSDPTTLTPFGFVEDRVHAQKCVDVGAAERGVDDGKKNNADKERDDDGDDGDDGGDGDGDDGGDGDGKHDCTVRAAVEGAPDGAMLVFTFSGQDNRFLTAQSGCDLAPPRGHRSKWKQMHCTVSEDESEGFRVEFDARFPGNGTNLGFLHVSWENSTPDSKDDHPCDKAEIMPGDSNDSTVYETKLHRELLRSAPPKHSQPCFS